MTVRESILKSIKSAAAYNRHELAAPRVILWPDEERLWMQCFGSLRESYPTLWALGDYSPSLSTGPAAWLRYQLEVQTGDNVPVIYLPGVGRSAFRSADQCPNHVKHLFALQFQGQFWTQKNGKSWTPFAYLSSADGGLALDVAGDQETKKAIQECLLALLEVEVDALRVGKLEAGDFRAIVTKDPAQTLLQWIGDPSKIKKELQRLSAEWDSFCAVCRTEYHFDPDKDGAITAAEKLSSSAPAWKLVWARYKEAPLAYPGIKEVLESVIPGDLFETASEYQPRYNRQEEERLEKDLLVLAAVSSKDAFARIQALAKEHGHRSTWVWVAFGEAPLALAITYLRDMSDIIEVSGNPATW